MADIDMKRNPNFAVFDFSPDEVIDIRKTALMAASMVYQGKSDFRAREYLQLAESFEEHLMRGVPKNG